MIDFEQWKFKVKLSQSTLNLLYQDMFRFGFVKTNSSESLNLNSFINAILPITFEYRKNQNEMLKKIILEKAENQSIQAIERMMELINLFSYEDKISYHDEIVNIRISKSNMEVFKDLFDGLDCAHIKKSPFFRSLINQYSNFKLDMREFLCFNFEYHYIEKAIEKRMLVNFYCKGIEKEFAPYSLVTCPINSEIYVLGILKNENSTSIMAVRLCEMRQIHIEKSNLGDFEKLSDQINSFIENMTYLETTTLLLKESDNGIV